MNNKYHNRTIKVMDLREIGSTGYNRIERENQDNECLENFTHHPI